MTAKRLRKTELRSKSQIQSAEFSAQYLRRELRSKSPFLVSRKKVSRRTSRSKMMVNSLLVTSEVNSKKALFIIDRL